VNPFGNSVTFKTAVNEVKAGVNYHFDRMLPFWRACSVKSNQYPEVGPRRGFFLGLSKKIWVT
jgi:hypothetical protein